MATQVCCLNLSHFLGVILSAKNFHLRRSLHPGIFSVNSSTRSSSLVRVQASSIGRLTEQSSRELLPRHVSLLMFQKFWVSLAMHCAVL